MVHTLIKVAEQDTPQQVHVPDSWGSLLVWAVGRFGGIIVATIMCAYALKQVYADMQTTNNRMLALMEARAASDKELGHALSELTKVVDDVRADARWAHDRVFETNGTPTQPSMRKTPPK